VLQLDAVSRRDEADQQPVVVNHRHRIGVRDEHAVSDRRQFVAGTNPPGDQPTQRNEVRAA
jgi:hypothetical protein